MSWDDDDCGGGNWGYDGDPVHDQWVDYTTDMYEGTDYSDENPGWDDHPTTVQTDTGRLEKEVKCLEGALAASLLVLADLEDKAVRASSRRTLAKFQRHIDDEKAKIEDYRRRMAEMQGKLESAKLNDTNRTTVSVSLALIALVILCLMLAIFI